MIKVGRIQTMIIGAIIVGFACLGQNFIDLWVGPDFSDSFICALLIIVPSFVYHTQQIASTAIIVQNKVKKQALVYTIMACCNILLALILSKYAGPIGICSSICVAYCIRAIGMNIIYYRDLNINVLKFFNRVFKPVVLPLVVVSSFGIFLNIYINSTVWIMLILKAILLYLVLSILYWYVYMNEQDKDIVKSILIRKR
jgi:O-antigen/teichoic acid export membrane protein